MVDGNFDAFFDATVAENLIYLSKQGKASSNNIVLINNFSI